MCFFAKGHIFSSGVRCRKSRDYDCMHVLDDEDAVFGGGVRVYVVCTGAGTSDEPQSRAVLEH